VSVASIGGGGGRRLGLAFGGLSGLLVGYSSFEVNLPEDVLDFRTVPAQARHDFCSSTM
jgi:hypothetical protein